MRYRYVHILAALFLVAGMTVQLVVSYSQARRQMQERIDLKMQIAQEKLLFEFYYAYEIWTRKESYVKMLGTGIPTQMNSLVLPDNGFTTQVNREAGYAVSRFSGSIPVRPGQFIIKKR